MMFGDKNVDNMEVYPTAKRGTSSACSGFKRYYVASTETTCSGS